MKIDLLCSSESHPINAWLVDWMASQANEHDVRLLRTKAELASGDVLFLISCTEVISKKERDAYRHCIVLHASDLPKGRGWSPHIWSILEGKSEIVVSAINAEDKVDSGAVWAKKRFQVAPHALYDEINQSLFMVEIALLNKVLAMVQAGEKPQPQPDKEPTYYPRRTAADSELDPDASIAAQFDKLRVADPDRYPAFVRLHGHVYAVSLRKVRSDDEL